ncbi:radical SAM family heme chaperone HemW [Demequina capsici]|uniref:Heme chaperone HemW n=1 Tax=Demequina capsici TaxID=3075620 RepID=A0AA96FGZ5_9MICO|nr:MULTISPECIES: radical SAM family heme chaperone HemW [unclassified Demequina]WNM25474.1 radical SAM family heme chaperone HemW [Demequina sp. OYTSA14]WNM28355.1 radical SAM family heme chaperone HemW [Demequina sp. PMTSA13]
MPERAPAATATASATHQRDLGVYIHVPFCRVRCGYCDFNTYAPSEVGGATREGYVESALREMALAARVMEGDARAASTVFLGGGTPTMLDASALAALLDGVRATWGLASDAEVTTEANPDSVSRESLRALADAGYTRVSFGMQSAVPHVLAVLERTHDPDNVARAVGWAREAGLAVSVDLIYGTPGESLADWERSVDAAIALEPDHLSAYALVIEPGTRMGAQLKRGLIEPVDPDTQADMYELADARFAAAGYAWYEVSNWARGAEHACRHNIAYWRSQDWWGIGPGAHSYLGPRVDPDGGERGAERWWNVKHPRAYADRLAAGEDPAAEREPLTADDLALESVMLRLRLAEGMAIADLPERRPTEVARLVAEGVLDGRAALAGRLLLTLKGRLLADAAVRALT